MKIRSLPPAPPVELDIVLARKTSSGLLDATTGLVWPADLWEIAGEGPTLTKAEAAEVAEAALDQLPDAPA